MGEKHRVKRKVLRDTYKNGRTYGYVGETPTKTAKSPTKMGEPIKGIQLMKNVLSIIVPVYNSEKYIEKCICSLINQTYKYLEIVIINDGSTDDSVLLCKSYQKIDDRIKIYEQENKGVSAARNLGINKCTGNYIAFVDSDDTITNDFAEKMITALTMRNSNNAIGVCDCMIDDGNKRVEKKSNLFIDNWCIWGKIFPRNLIGTIRFNTDLKLAEDLLFLTDVYCENSNVQILYISLPLYCYYQNLESATHRLRYDINDLLSLQTEASCYERLSRENIDLGKTLLITNGIIQIVRRIYGGNNITGEEKRDFALAKKIWLTYKAELKRKRIINHHTYIKLECILNVPLTYHFYKITKNILLNLREKVLKRGNYT